MARAIISNMAADILSTAMNSPYFIYKETKEGRSANSLYERRLLESYTIEPRGMGIPSTAYRTSELGQAVLKDHIARVKAEKEELRRREYEEIRVKKAEAMEKATEGLLVFLKSHLGLNKTVLDMPEEGILWQYLSKLQLWQLNDLVSICNTLNK